MKTGFSAGVTAVVAAAVCMVIWMVPCLCSAGEGDRVFLWCVAGNKGTLHLLGSVHVLKKDADPLDERIEEAYAKSRRVVFEADEEEMSGAPMQKVLAEYGMYPEGTTLKDHVSKATLELLERKAKAAGLDMSQLERLRPWLCAVSLSGAELGRLGFDPSMGIDARYAARAKKDGKGKIFLESSSMQIELLARMPEDRQEELLKQALRELEVIGEKSAALMGAWKSGDPETLEAIVNISLTEHPQIRKDLFTDRNMRWMSRLEDLLQHEGDTLVIVGAGHLVGDDGILNLLREKGYSPVQQ